ncbi:hypothetical protein [Xenorhabdus sp. PB30.3]|uniref:hypothetical protein n=1 Tax=Xenorhabdus sp. PB30.3 TaxID=2788941 RepID=UPI001E342366|nr:hypothetical protein [Xenorhabdus sp. PB30.3]MCC8379553.1 hypothetical protein [Xenorhabdus sp. PB30.3]
MNSNMAISKLIRELASLVIEPNKEEPHPEAADNEMYELRFSLTDSGKYVLINMSDQTETIPHRLYVFVNRIDEPGIIRMAKCPDHGHTSLTYHRYLNRQEIRTVENIAVYYAGTARFEHGVLEWWDNYSGHYRPDSDLSRNFIPYIRRLLPQHLFKE